MKEEKKRKKRRKEEKRRKKGRNERRKKRKKRRKEGMKEEKKKKKACWQNNVINMNIGDYHDKDDGFIYCDNSNFSDILPRHTRVSVQRTNLFMAMCVDLQHNICVARYVCIMMCCLQQVQ